MYNVKLIWLSVAGFVWRWLLWCFESRARAAVARAAIFIVARSSKCVSDIMLKWKMKWTVTRVSMWMLCDRVVEASIDWVFVAHFIHLFNTEMPMPCTDIPYTRKPRCYNSYTGGLVWLSGFEFPVAGHLCVQSVMHACLFAKCTTRVQYI